MLPTKKIMAFSFFMYLKILTVEFTFAVQHFIILTKFYINDIIYHSEGVEFYG